MQFSFNAKGHFNVLSTHKTTIEVTKDDFLTKNGDCIIGICAENSLFDLPEEIKFQLKEGKKARITFECGGIKDTVNAKGSEKLSFKSTRCMIIRKSNHICGRTLAIKADKASCDLKRDLIENLKQAKDLIVTIEV